MKANFITKHFWPESKPQNLEEQKPHRYEKLKAIGYGTLALIATVAISIIAAILAYSVTLSFYTFINLETYYWFEYTFSTSVLLASSLSIYPIIKIAGPIFATAKNHWNNI
ncbi:MAG: hypothetical protein K1000chlam3_01606 [Chlamydiae bacterium]|nr:hypothetical protein [Chlamydiota bacterium]